MLPPRNLALSLLACAAWAPSAAAQTPPAWSELSVPGGVDPQKLVSLGRLISYHESNALHVWSGVHRRWRAIAATATAPVRLMNDCLLLRDGTTWNAFSAYTGRFAALTVSLNAQLLNPGSQNNDSIFLVLDGNMLHAFSGFVGTWISRPVTGNTGFAVQRHTALLADGTLLSGMDAFSGVWHDTTVATPPQALECDGIAGLAIGPTEVHGFSAMHRSWQTSPAVANALFVRDDDWGMFWSSNQVLAYSGVTGQFTSIQSGATTVPYRRELCAVIGTPAGFRAYSAARGTFTPVLASSNAAVQIATATATLRDGLQLTGYSAISGTSSTITLDSSAEAVSTTVAVAVENVTGRPFCYSTLLDAWYPPPLDAQAGLPPITGTSILLPATSGVYAFSARTGSFVPLAGSGFTLLGNDQSSIAAAWDANAIFAFDARADAWRSVPRSSTAPPSIQIWRTSMFAVDGGAAHGFGAQSGVWESILLPEPFVSGRANSESSRVETATYVLGHSATPTTLCLTQFPEFRRVQPIGSIARFTVPLHGGGIGFLAGGGFATQPTQVPGLGDFWLTTPLATVLLIAAPGEERATYDLSLPSSPILVGSQWAFQALAIPNQGAPYLGDAAALYVM